MSNAALQADYLFLGPLLEQWLRSEIGENIAVEGVESMAQARDAQEQRELVLYVMWGGDRIDPSQTGRAGAGTSQRIMQRWVVLVRVGTPNKTAKAARNTRVGPLLSAVHKAVAGWQPEGCYAPFVRTQGPAPDYAPASGLYPLAFEINLVL